MSKKHSVIVAPVQHKNKFLAYIKPLSNMSSHSDSDTNLGNFFIQ